MNVHRLNTLTITLLMLLTALTANAACPPPTPGQPHVCLTWTASTSGGILGYNVLRGTTPGGESSTPLNGSTPLTTTTFYDSSAAVGSTYFYTVVAIGTGGVLSAPSNETSVQIPVPPNAPTGLSSSID